MATIEVSDAIARRLREIAEREQRTVDDVLDAALEQLEGESAQEDEALNYDTLMYLAENAVDLRVPGGKEVTTRNSREFLKNNFGDYLMKRLKGSDGES